MQEDYIKREATMNEEFLRREKKMEEDFKQRESRMQEQFMKMMEVQFKSMFSSQAHPQLTNIRNNGKANALRSQQLVTKQRKKIKVHDSKGVVGHQIAAVSSPRVH